MYLLHCIHVFKKSKIKNIQHQNPKILSLPFIKESNFFLFFSFLYFLKLIFSFQVLNIIFKKMLKWLLKTIKNQVKFSQANQVFLIKIKLSKNHIVASSSLSNQAFPSFLSNLCNLNISSIENT